MEIKNKEFRRLMKEAGLEEYKLIKGDGYFYVTDTCGKTGTWNTTSIYVSKFSMQSPAAWVADIKNLIKDNS